MSELFNMQFANCFDVFVGVCVLVMFLSLTVLSVTLAVLAIKELF